MKKGLGLAVVLVGVLARPVLAQSPDNAGAGSDTGAGVRSGNITATGQTVPHPGASQSAGTTSLDRGIQQEDTKIQGSICKGC